MVETRIIPVVWFQFKNSSALSRVSGRLRTLTMLSLIVRSRLHVLALRNNIYESQEQRTSSRKHICPTGIDPLLIPIKRLR